MNQEEQQVEKLELARVAAVCTGDAATAETFLADEYTHINSTGRVIDKAFFLENMQGRQRETSRGPLTIRVYGDAATIVGEQHNRTIREDGSVTSKSYIASQVLKRVGDQWQFVLMQLTDKPEKK